MNKVFISQNVGNNGIITIPNGRIPVIVIDGKDLDNYEYANSIVNFLRCGCPKVQILILNFNNLDFQTGISNKIYILIAKYLKPLQLPNEEFTYEIQLPVVFITNNFTI